MLYCSFAIAIALASAALLWVFFEPHALNYMIVTGVFVPCPSTYGTSFCSGPNNSAFLHVAT